MDRQSPLSPPLSPSPSSPQTSLRTRTESEGGRIKCQCGGEYVWDHRISGHFKTKKHLEDVLTKNRVCESTCEFPRTFRGWDLRTVLCAECGKKKESRLPKSISQGHRAVIAEISKEELGRKYFWKPVWYPGVYYLVLEQSGERTWGYLRMKRPDGYNFSVVIVGDPNRICEIDHYDPLSDPSKMWKTKLSYITRGFGDALALVPPELCDLKLNCALTDFGVLCAGQNNGLLELVPPNKIQMNHIPLNDSIVVQGYEWFEASDFTKITIASASVCGVPREAHRYPMPKRSCQPWKEEVKEGWKCLRLLLFIQGPIKAATAITEFKQGAFAQNIEETQKQVEVGTRLTNENVEDLRDEIRLLKNQVQGLENELQQKDGINFEQLVRKMKEGLNEEIGIIIEGDEEGSGEEGNEGGEGSGEGGNEGGEGSGEEGNEGEGNEDDGFLQRIWKSLHEWWINFKRSLSNLFSPTSNFSRDIRASIRKNSFILRLTVRAGELKMELLSFLTPRKDSSPV